MLETRLILIDELGDIISPTLRHFWGGKEIINSIVLKMENYKSLFNANFSWWCECFF